MSSLLSQPHAGRQVKPESSPESDLPFSLLDRVVPGLPAALETACLSEPDLVPYRMRQAIGQQLGRRAVVDLTAAVLALPRSTQSYTRHVLHADPLGRFTVVGLVWGSQQYSPIHAHYAWCAYRILAGELTEGLSLDIVHVGTRDLSLFIDWAIGRLSPPYPFMSMVSMRGGLVRTSIACWPLCKP